MKKEYVELGLMRLLNEYYGYLFVIAISSSLIFPIVYSYLASNNIAWLVILLILFGVFIGLVALIKITKIRNKIIKKYKK